MRLSLNEIEVTARKAALGAGYPLGLAEDAGATAAWLAAAGFPIAELMTAALETARAEPRLEHNGANARIVAEQGPCSALRVAPSACDIVLAAAGSGEPVAVEATLDVPVLAIAQAALVSASSGVSLRIEIAGEPAMEVAQGQPVFFTGAAKLSALRGEAVRISIANPQPQPPPVPGPGRETALGQGIPVDAALWEAIRRLAARTLVPATLQSRERGAGAGLIDTD
jgi:hypothetical protein